MSNILQLNQQFINVGLDTQTITIAASGIYNVQVVATIPAALPTGAGGGSAADQGLGALGGSPGIVQGNNTTPGDGGQGLGFGGTPGQAYNASGSGYGAGAGGGAEGFSQGDQGAGHGGVGQGFGASNGYQQPPAYVNVPSSGAAQSSSLSIVVNQNGSPVYTSIAPTGTQRQIKFKVLLNCTAADVITVVLSSSNANDKQLNSLQSQISVNQGQN